MRMMGEEERAMAAVRGAQEKIRASERYLDKIRGCLFGGAVGDALGYPVEFLSEKEIFSRFGEGGILQYVLDEESGKASISDDTQMTLFTANGILVGETRRKMRGIVSGPITYIAMAYQDWLRTQEISFAESRRLLGGPKRKCSSWLCDVPQLYAWRAPGNTCMSSLKQQQKNGPIPGDPIQMPQNASKGCGGIMRVAPVALIHTQDIRELDMEGARTAAITHGHSLGYMPAAVLTHILHRIVFQEGERGAAGADVKGTDDAVVQGTADAVARDALRCPDGTAEPCVRRCLGQTSLSRDAGHHQLLRASILEARDTVAELFRTDGYTKKLTAIIDLAIRLSENDQSDLENIHQIGEGWVAEETLGIALYCALRHPDDFSEGVIAAVDHKGDSDSTGAVTGNILGALLGYDRIEEKWKKDLEIADVILEMADDLCHGCQMSEYSPYQDPDWERKYIHMQWKEGMAKKAPKTGFMAVKGDITKDHDVEAIVNAANTSLLGGGGVDGAIHRAAGPGLLEECRLLSGCETGKAKITSAYQLPCEHVIHTPGPRWRGGDKKERELLASCYRSCLELAVKKGIRKIAFPSISTGVYQFPLEEAVKIAVGTVKGFVSEHPGELDFIKWVLFDDRTFDAYREELDRLEAAESLPSPDLYGMPGR